MAPAIALIAALAAAAGLNTASAALQTYGWRACVVPAAANHFDLPGVIRLMQAFGLPYDVYPIHTNMSKVERVAEWKPLPLFADAAKEVPRCSVLVTNGSPDAANGLTAEEDSDVRRLESVFGVRRIEFSAAPSATHGTLVKETGLLDGSFYLADAARAATPALQPDLSLCSEGAYFLTAVEVVDAAVATPFIQFRKQAAGSCEGDEGTLTAAVLASYDGGTREHLKVYFSFGIPFAVPGLGVLGTALLEWGVRGAWPGRRRVILSVQVDDLFLATTAFLPGINGHGSLEERIGAGDLDFNYQHVNKMLETYMPKDSFLHIELAFNGNGVRLNGGPAADGLWLHAKELLDKYYWLTHTFSHLSLTVVDQNPESCLPQYGSSRHLKQTPYDAAYCEVTRNQRWADRLYEAECNRNITVSEAFVEEAKQRCPSFSPTSIVTPRISGLFNADALRAMLDAGLTNCVGDNSCSKWQNVTAGEGTCSGNLQPPTWYEGMYTTEEVNGWPGFYIIPRYATNVFYDVARREQEVAQYRHVFRNAPALVNYTLPQIMAREAAAVSTRVLAYEPSSHMFHQANMMAINLTEEDTGVEGFDGRASLLTYWIEAVSRAIARFTRLPVITFPQDELGEYVKVRMYKNDCPVDVFAVTNASAAGGRIAPADGSIVAVAFRPRAANYSFDCTFPLTGFSALWGDGVASPAFRNVWFQGDAGLPPQLDLARDVQFLAVREEHYGPDTTTYVTVPAGTNHTLVVPGAMTVTPASFRVADVAQAPGKAVVDVEGEVANPLGFTHHLTGAGLALTVRGPAFVNFAYTTGLEVVNTSSLPGAAATTTLHTFRPTETPDHTFTVTRLPTTGPTGAGAAVFTADLEYKGGSIPGDPVPVRVPANLTSTCNGRGTLPAPASPSADPRCRCRAETAGGGLADPVCEGKCDGGGGGWVRHAPCCRCDCAQGYYGYWCEGTCPGGTTFPCSGHGTCDQVSGACACDTGFGGADCSQACPRAEGQVCGGHGSCDPEAATCSCDRGHTGAACSLRCPSTAVGVCSGNGRCTGAGVCDCDPGYTGSVCELAEPPSYVEAAMKLCLLTPKTGVVNKQHAETLLDKWAVPHSEHIIFSDQSVGKRDPAYMPIPWFDDVYTANPNCWAILQFSALDYTDPDTGVYFYTGLNATEQEGETRLKRDYAARHMVVEAFPLFRFNEKKVSSGALERTMRFGSVGRAAAAEAGVDPDTVVCSKNQGVWMYDTDILDGPPSNVPFIQSFRASDACGVAPDLVNDTDYGPYSLASLHSNEGKSPEMLRQHFSLTDIQTSPVITAFFTAELMWMLRGVFPGERGVSAAVAEQQRACPVDLFATAAVEAGVKGMVLSRATRGVVFRWRAPGQPLPVNCSLAVTGLVLMRQREGASFTFQSAATCPHCPNVTVPEPSALAVTTNAVGDTVSRLALTAGTSATDVVVPRELDLAAHHIAVAAPFGRRLEVGERGDPSFNFTVQLRQHHDLGFVRYLDNATVTAALTRNDTASTGAGSRRCLAAGDDELAEDWGLRFRDTAQVEQLVLERDPRLPGLFTARVDAGLSLGQDLVFTVHATAHVLGGQEATLTARVRSAPSASLHALCATPKPQVVAPMPSASYTAGKPFRLVVPSGTFSDGFFAVEQLEVTARIKHSGAAAGLTFEAGRPGEAAVVGPSTGTGTAVVTLTATDPAGATGQDAFALTFTRALPFVAEPLPVERVAAGMKQTLVVPTTLFRDWITPADEVEVEASPIAYQGSACCLIFLPGPQGEARLEGISAGNGTATLRLTGTNDVGLNATAQWTVQLVDEPPFVVAPIPSQDGSTKARKVAASGELYSFTVPAGTFGDLVTAPDALVLHAAFEGAGTNATEMALVGSAQGEARVEGTPKGPGTMTVSLTATDEVSRSVTHNFSIEVSKAPAPAISIPTQGESGSGSGSGSGSDSGGSSAPVVAGKSYSYVMQRSLFAEEDVDDIWLEGHVNFTGTAGGLYFVSGEPGRAQVVGVPYGSGTANVYVTSRRKSNGLESQFAFDIVISPEEALGPTIPPGNGTWAPTLADFAAYAGGGAVVGFTAATVALTGYVFYQLRHTGRVSAMPGSKTPSPHMRRPTSVPAPAPALASGTSSDPARPGQDDLRAPSYTDHG